MDPLGEALHFLRMSGTSYCTSELTAPWGLQLPRVKGGLTFHVLASGACWLEVPGTQRLRLAQGDLALVPHGEGHRLASGPGAATRPIDDLPHDRVSARYKILRHGGGGAATHLVCGAVRFDHPAAHRLMAELPRIIHVPASSSRSTEWLEGTLRFMAAEAREPRPGGETVITRLADILVIQAIRSWMETDPAAQTGWLGALRDPQIGRAIALVHREPGRDWALGSLAREVGMSRSAFAARFAELVGEPAMHYVARWRMHVAVGWLKEDHAAVGELAGRLGYRSEAAFSRAFKRFIGAPPGAVRRDVSRTAGVPIPVSAKVRPGSATRAGSDGSAGLRRW
jgi:AraC-like DNA-binding protein